MKKTIFTLVLLAIIGLSTANAQLGIGTTTPDASSILDVTSTEKGFLPPRMDTDARDGISNPATGLMIYNLDVPCLQVNDGTPAAPIWNCISGPAGVDPATDTDGDGVPDVTDSDPSDPCLPAQAAGYTGFDAANATWRAADCDGDGDTNGEEADCGSDPYDASSTCSGSTFGNIPGNTTCETATISVTPCSAVSGTTESTVLADGTLYNWTDAGSYMSGGTADALVEIGGQCWFGRNTTAKPTAPIADDPNTGSNMWGATSVNDEGYWGYYNLANNNSWGTTEPATGEGLLYQWSAAMNGSDTERAQGVCPTGWHVPSDCEWMYLENSLGMSIADQEGTGFRNSGNVGGKLSTLTRETPASANGTGTNSSGFTALLAGYRVTNGTFGGRGTDGDWWSSSETSTTNAQRRSLYSSQAGVTRTIGNKARGYSVRCLKD